MRSAFLGLPREQALSLVDRSHWTGARLDGLRGAVGPGCERLRPGAYRLFPPAADGFFMGEWLDLDPASESGRQVFRSSSSLPVAACSLRRRTRRGEPAAEASRCPRLTRSSFRTGRAGQPFEGS